MFQTRDGQTFLVGDIPKVDFPAVNGSEFAGRHPAIIMGIPNVTPQCMTVVPLSSNPEVARFPDTVVIHSNLTNRLERDSVAVTFRIAHCDVQRIIGRYGRIDPEDMEAIKVRIRNHLGL